LLTTTTTTAETTTTTKTIFLGGLGNAVVWKSVGKFRITTPKKFKIDRF